MSHATVSVSRPRLSRGQTIENAVSIAQKTTLPNRSLILDTAIRLYDSAPVGSLVSLVAERVRMPRAVVESVLVIWLLQFRSESSAFRVGIANAMDIARTAGCDAWRLQ